MCFSTVKVLPDSMMLILFYLISCVSLASASMGPGQFELKPEDIPHVGPEMKNPREVSLHEVVGAYENDTGVTILHDIGAWAKPCVSPVWQEGDPICGNGRRVVVNGSSVWMVPDGEPCQLKCPSEKWYLQPNVEELRCGSVLLNGVPEEGVSCSCCVWQVTALMFMLPILCILPCFFRDFRRRCFDRDQKIDDRVALEKFEEEKRTDEMLQQVSAAVPVALAGLRASAMMSPN